MRSKRLTALRGYEALGLNPPRPIVSMRSKRLTALREFNGKIKVFYRDDVSMRSKRLTALRGREPGEESEGGPYGLNALEAPDCFAGKVVKLNGPASLPVSQCARSA